MVRVGYQIQGQAEDEGDSQGRQPCQAKALTRSLRDYLSPPQCSRDRGVDVIFFVALGRTVSTFSQIKGLFLE
jgi:hypothetical protein